MAASDLRVALRTRIVSGRLMLDMALASARPGDHIVLADGTYSGSTLTIAANGTAQHPIVIRAANRVQLSAAGAVTVSGARIRHRIAVSGNDVWLYGLNFDGVDWHEGQHYVTLSGTRNVVKRCRIHAWKGRCVLVSNGSTYARVSRNDMTVKDFSDLSGLTADQVDVHPTRNRTGVFIEPQSQYCEIDYNHFHDFPPGIAPYGTTKASPILCGEGSATQIRSQYAHVHHNLFRKCEYGASFDATAFEIKGSDNLVELNTWLDCKGHVTSRQGVRNRFIANWIKNNTRAMRMFDADHELVGNVLENCPAGIQIMAGSVPWDAPHARKNDRYPQAQNVLLAGNRRVGSSGAFLRVGTTFSGRDPTTLPALNTRIEGWDASKGPIAYGRHLGTRGPTPRTQESWPQAELLTAAQVGLDSGLL